MLTRLRCLADPREVTLSVSKHDDPRRHISLSRPKTGKPTSLIIDGQVRAVGGSVAACTSAPLTLIFFAGGFLPRSFLPLRDPYGSATSLRLDRELLRSYFWIVLTVLHTSYSSR